MHAEESANALTSLRVSDKASLQPLVEYEERFLFVPIASGRTIRKKERKEDEKELEDVCNVRRSVRRNTVDG